jgi:hypothetical protein
MNEAEFAAALKSAKSEYELRAQGFRNQIERAKLVIQKAELKLVSLADDCNRKAQEITSAYLNLPQGAAAGSAPLGAEHDRKRMRRGSLDTPVFEMILSLGKPSFTLPDVCEAWTARHPEEPVTRSTMGGVVKRLARIGRLDVVKNGSPGPANPRQYRVETTPAHPGMEVNEVTH